MVVGVVAVAALSGCGAAETDGTEAEPSQQTVVDPRFDGAFTVTELVVDGTDLPLSMMPRIVIESSFGDLTVEPGCNTYFGSLSLTEDGGASFTVTGGSDQNCENLAAQEQGILDALAIATAWEASDDGFQFRGENTAITVTR